MINNYRIIKFKTEMAGIGTNAKGDDDLRLDDPDRSRSDVFFTSQSSQLHLVESAVEYNGPSSRDRTKGNLIA